MGTFSVDLTTLVTGHRRLNRRLRSADLLGVTDTSHLLIRASRPWAGKGAWSLIGMLRVGRVTEAVPVRAQLTAPDIDSAVVKVDVTICRLDSGLTRYRLSPQFRLHIDAELSRAGTDGRW